MASRKVDGVTQHNERLTNGTKTPTCVAMESIATSVDKLPDKEHVPSKLFICRDAVKRHRVRLKWNPASPKGSFGHGADIL
ncbi:MAG TPA: hypothetical protein VIS48_06890 [Candidatus Kryptonia bacterium]